MSKSKLTHWYSLPFRDNFVTILTLSRDETRDKKVIIGTKNEIIPNNDTTSYL